MKATTTLPNRFKTIFNELMIDFGFRGCADFMNSVFHADHTKPIMLFSVSLGTLASLFEEFLGIEPAVYVAFCGLITMEFVTGIMASLNQGIKIESKRFGRFIIKMGCYVTIVGLVNIFKTKLAMPVMFGTSIDIYGWIYYVSFNMIVIQLIISVFENFVKLGLSESNLVVRYVREKTKKWFKIDE